MSYEERVWAKVNKTQGCWTWTASLDRHGYGQMRGRHGGTRRAHRVVYEMERGAIPGGLDLDHLCRNPACVNPDHLEPVTRRVNLIRGAGLVAQNYAKSHCKRGHPFDESNTYLTKKGHRECRRCHADRERSRQKSPSESLR